MIEPVDGRTIVRDLEELGVDPAVVRTVRFGLSAISNRIRDLRGTGNAGAPLVLRDDVLRIVDPGRAGLEAGEATFADDPTVSPQLARYQGEGR